MLDKFRETAITWDKATRRIYSPITANGSDSNGRKLNIQVVNSGQVENLTGATLHLYWETKDKSHYGLDAFNVSDISKGEFELFYTTGMLSNVGELNATLVLVDSTGKVVSDWFKITVTRGINEGAIESENSFTTLTQALIDIGNLEQNYAPRLNDLTAQLQQKAQQSDLDNTKIDLESKADKTYVDGTNARIDELIIGSGDANAEVTDAHVSAVKNKTFTTISNRFDEIEEVVGFKSTNMVVNGNFVGTTGWNTNDSSTLSAASNTLTITGTGAQTYLYAYSDNVNITLDHVYYMKIRYKPNGVAPTKSEFRISSIVATEKISPSLNTWDTLSGLYKAASTRDYPFNLRVDYGTTTDALNSTVDVQYAIMVDLTKTFGAGNEPDVTKFEEMLSYVSNSWFDKSTDLVRNKYLFDKIEAQGSQLLEVDNLKTIFNIKDNNLYDGTSLTGVFSDGTGKVVYDNDPTYKRTDYIKVEPNAKLTHNLTTLLPASATHKCNFFDVNMAHISTVTQPKTVNYFIVPPNARYVVFALKTTTFDVTSSFDLRSDIKPSSVIVDMQNHLNRLDELLKTSDNIIPVYDFYDVTKTDSQIIDDCLAFCSIFEERIVVFDKKDWYIDKAILLPSNTTVIIDGCMIKQNNEVFDNVFRGDNLTINESDPWGMPLSVAEIENIKILGKNGAKIVGCDVNKKSYHPVLLEDVEMVGDDWGWRTFQISLSRCNGFEVGNIEFTQTRCWCNSFDRCSNGYVHDLHIVSSVPNGDGVDFRAGCHHCRVENITGNTSDDTVACTALNLGTVFPVGSYLYPLEPSSYLNDIEDVRALDIHDMTISNISAGGPFHSVIVLAAEGARNYNIQINDIVDGGTVARKATVEIYTGFGGNYNANDLHNIRVNNVVSKRANFAIKTNAKMDNVWFNKIKQEKVGGTLMSIVNPDGVTVTNSPE